MKDHHLVGVSCHRVCRVRIGYLGSTLPADCRVSGWSVSRRRGCAKSASCSGVTRVFICLTSTHAVSTGTLHTWESGKRSTSGSRAASLGMNTKNLGQAGHDILIPSLVVGSALARERRCPRAAGGEDGRSMWRGNGQDAFDGCPSSAVCEKLGAMLFWCCTLTPTQSSTPQRDMSINDMQLTSARRVHHYAHPP